MALLEMRGVSGEFDEPIYPTGTPRTITTSSGQTYNYDDVVNLILARYAEGKNPALAVKSALQLGFPEDVIRTLPGVDAQAFEEGKRLIESGAFVEQATGTKADIQQAAPVGSAQYNARIAAGLDAFGFPPEEVARLTAQGLYGAGKQFDPGTPERQPLSAATEPGPSAQGTGMAQTAPAGGLLAQAAPNLPVSVMQKASELLSGSGMANNPRFADQPVGSFGEGGKVYSVYGDGSITAITEGAEGDYYYEGFTPEGMLAAEEYSDKFKQTPFDKAVGVAANALIAAGTAAALGPLGVGLSTPAAAAAGSGATTLISTGDPRAAAQAALLGGTIALGAETLFPTAATEVANQATNLASQGASEELIKTTLVNNGVNVGTAANIAADAVAGVPASQIASDIAGITLNQVASTTPGAANLVNITGANVPGLLATAPGSIVGAAASQIPSLLTRPTDITNQQVQVQSQTGGGQQAATTAIPAAGAGLLAQTQTVPVTSQTAPTTQQTAGPAGAMLGAAIAPTQTVPIETRTIPTQERAVTIPVVASESVTVPGKREPVPTATALIPAGAAGAAAGVTAPATPTSPFSATDAALAALLLGGAGSLLNQSQSGGFTMDPNLANSIINAPRPTYRGGVGGYQMPGMFQIAPTNVYNPFATTAPFGTGRFGGFSAPITLPRGLV